MPRTVSIPTTNDLEAARQIVSQHLLPTPLLGTGERTWLKLESLQPTGAFKVRGALASLGSIVAGARIVTASAGNHALGVAWASKRLGIPATIVVAETAAPVKIEKLRHLEAGLVLYGRSYDEAEAHAIDLAADGGHFLSGYNDTHVIAGQATVLDEILAQLPDDGLPLTVISPVGGGGLLSGIALRASGIRNRDIRLVGVEAKESLAVSTSVATGTTVDVHVGDTLADGLSGNVEANSITVDILREHHVRFTSVSEAQIRAALRWLFREQGLVAEGAAATTVAALHSGIDIPEDGHIVSLITGRNITWPTLQDILDHKEPA